MTNEKQMHKAAMIVWYQRRVKALEGLLVCYRIGGRPSERLLDELKLTSVMVDAKGQWRDKDIRDLDRARLSRHR